MNRLLIALLFVGACFGQVGPLPDALFPAFFNNLNTALGNAVAVTGTYTNPSWLVSIPYTKVTGMSATAPIVYSGGVFSCAVATGSVPGCISAADWTKFNSATSAGTPLQKGDGAGGFVSSSLSDNGTTVSTTEAFSAKAVTTGDATSSGGTCWSGFTSGTVCIVSANAASGGTDVAYIMPSTIGVAGQLLKDNGSTTCPTLAAGSPTTCHQMVWATPASVNGTQITSAGFNGGTLAAATTNYLGLGQGSLRATEGLAQTIMPQAGTLSKLRLVTSGSQGSAALTVTLRVNGAACTSPSTMSITVSASAGAGTFSDLTNSCSWNAGDTVNLQFTEAAGATSATLSSWSALITY